MPGALLLVAQQAVAEGTNGMRQLLGQQRKAEGARWRGGSNAEIADEDEGGQSVGGVTAASVR